MIKTPLSTVIGGAFWTPSCTVIGGAKLSSETVMKKLFSNNEQGFFYDPSDLSTMFQDAAGTIPVTGVGQPVGLVLDKSKGLVLGDELFNAIWNTTSYPCTYTWSNSVLTVNGAAGSYATMSTPFNTEIGATYTIEVNVTSNNTGYWLVLSNGAVSDSTKRRTIIGASSVGAKKYKYTFIATATQTHLHLNKGTKSVIATFTDITCKKISGNHATSATSASRPILQKNATTGAYYLAFDGSNVFLQTANINFTSTDKVSLFAGVRKLSDAAVGVIISSNQGGNGSFEIYQPATAGGNDYVFSTSGSTGAKYTTAGKYIAPNSSVLAAKVDIGVDLRSFSVNGAVFQNSAVDMGTSSFSNAPLYIGRRGGTSLSFNGHLYSLIGIGRLTTDSETKALEEAIAKNVGVTLNI